MKKNNKEISENTYKKNKNSLNVSNIISNKKLKLFLIIIYIGLLLLVLRLFTLQIIDGSYLSSLAADQQITSEKITSKRGNIYDSTGSFLAISETVDTISINPSKIVAKTQEDTVKLKETIAKGLADIFELDYNQTLEKINSSQSSVVIARKVEEDKVNNLKKWMKENKIYNGINIDEDYKRFYPNGSVASQIIGSCGTDNQGLAGIEYSYDSILTGTSGKLITSTDATQSEIPNSEQFFIPAENGYNLTLTIDLNIQKIVEKYLKQAVEENLCSNGGNVIIMDPKTGYILAMASCPDYDLNSPFTPTSFYADNWDNLSSEEKSSRIYQMWKVRSVSETYEPGSVFKLITASTALEENFTKPDIANDFYCNGFEQIYNIQIKCWSYPSTHQGESLREALMDSCNPSFMQLAKRIGASALYKYYNAFGFFNKTNSGLPGEANSLFVSEEKCGPVELATMAFGQRFTITPLHMITAICAISNDGYLVKPQIVKSMTNTDTGEITEFNKTIVRRVLSSQTCNQMKSMMESVVKDGTGQNAKVDGYSIGGKSGTSEPISGDKTSGYTTSFAAITPIDDPQLVVLVTLYNPQGKSHMGGQTAAPVVANILSEVLPYLGIAPEN